MKRKYNNVVNLRKPKLLINLIKQLEDDQICARTKYKKKLIKKNEDKEVEPSEDLHKNVLAITTKGEEDEEQITKGKDKGIDGTEDIYKNIDNTSKVQQSVTSIKSNLSKILENKISKCSTVPAIDEEQITKGKDEDPEEHYKNIDKEIDGTDDIHKNLDNTSKFQQSITSIKSNLSKILENKISKGTIITAINEEQLTKEPEELYRNVDKSKPDLSINVTSIVDDDQPSKEYKEKFIKYANEQEYLHKIREEKNYDWPMNLKENIENFQSVYKKTKAPEFNIDDMDFLKQLSAGTFGRVVLSMDIHNDQFYAVKIMNKKQLIAYKQVEHAKMEKEILESINFEFIPSLLYFFQTAKNLYYVITLVIGEEFYNYLINVDKINEPKAKFYSSQIVLALEYLQNLNIVHRDLKPENIMMDFDGYLKLTDFGFSKVVNDRTYTICGTPEYMAPELFTHQGYGLSVDWWSLGILIYEMCAGYTPFVEVESLKMMDKISNCTFRVPKHFSNDLRKLLKSLLVLDLSRRYSFTLDHLKNIKNDNWFVGVNWNSILNRKQRAPYLPKLTRFGKLSKIRLDLIDTDISRSDISLQNYYDEF